MKRSQIRIARHNKEQFSFLALELLITFRAQQYRDQLTGCLFGDQQDAGCQRFVQCAARN